MRPSSKSWEISALGPQRAAFGLRGGWRRLLVLVVSFNIFWTAAGESLFTAWARNTVPAAPSSLVATAVSSTQINVTWVDNSSNETGFIVQRAPSSTGPWTQIASLGAGATSYSNTGLTAGTTYFYRVYAYNSRGNSAYSNVASATTTACTYSISPTSASPSSAAGSGSVTVTPNSSTCAWSASSSATAWLTCTPASGTGSGTVSWSATANTGTTSRTGTLTIGGQTFTVNQAATSTSGGGISNNLVGYWTLDTANVSGTTALDSSGSGNNGSLMGTTTPTLVTGKIAQAGDLTDSSQCVMVPDSASLNLTGPFTVSAWVNFNSLPVAGQYPNVVAKLTSPAGYYGYGLFWNGSGVAAIIGPGSAMWYTTSPYVPSAGAWNHFVSVFDGTNLKLYVNGVQYSQVAASAPGSTATIPIKMGPHYSNPSAYGVINGKFDDVRVYSRALSATDVSQLYSYAGSGCTYTITTSSSPSGAGTATGGGTTACGSPVTVTATPGTGYNFVNWTQNGTVLSSSASYTYTPTSSGTLVANFAAVPCTYTISTSASPSGGGTTSGGGTVNCGSSVTVTATAASCYHFVNWTQNGTAVSSLASYTFTPGASQTLIANFAQNTFTISASASPAAGGSVTGGGTVNCGASVTVTATAATGYSFSSWTENGTVVTTTPSYTFTASANRTLVANFAATPCTYTISTSASPSAGGTASGGGSVNCGSTVTVTATPASCYHFVNWTQNGTAVSSLASYSFTANASATLVANFAQNTYTVSASTSPTAGGSVTGGGTVNCGASVTVTATAASCYNFVNWTENGAAVSSSASYTFTASANRTLVANFTLKPYTISTSSSPTAGGSTSGGGTVNCGSSVTVTATAASGYSFSSWTESGGVVSSSAGYTFTASANRTLVANFTAVPCTFSLSSGSGSFGAAGGSGSVTVNASSSTCSWSASSSYSWLHTSSSGTGSGLAGYTVDANASSAGRSGSLTIAGQTFSVTQSGHSGPIANAGPNQSTSVGTALTFNGSGSTAQDGATITNYSWALGDLSYASGISFSHAYSSAGTYGVTLTVTDSMGASGSGNCTATVTNVLCALNPALTAPANGSTLSNTVTLTGTASTCAVKVEFYCDTTVLVGTATTAPYSSSWNTTSAANGSHTLCAKAYDAAGNWTTSASSSVTVNNGTTNSAGQLQWVKTMLCGTMTIDVAQCWSVAADPSGNVFVAGDFNDTVDFGTGPISCFYPSDLGGFLAKYTPQGSLAWAKTFGAPGAVDNGASARGVVVDSQNNLVVAGYFYGTVDFGGISLTADNPSNLKNMTDIFVAKFSPSGTLLWVKQFGGSAPDLAFGVVLDASDNIFLAGYISSTDAHFGSITLGTSSGNPNAAVAKLSSAGAVLWARAFSGLLSEAFGLAVDRSGDVVVTGKFNGTTDFGGGPITATGTSIFVAKYSGLDGTYRWAKGVGGSGFNEGVGIATDPTTTNIVVSGAFTGTADFGGGPVSSAAQATFLAGYDPSGKFLWVKTYGGATGNSDCGNAVKIDAKGNLLFTGLKGSAWNIGGASVYTGGLFLLSYTLSGNAPPALRWYKFEGSSSTGSGTGNGITLDPFGHVLATGSFSYTVDFGGISATTANNTQSGFVAQYSN